MAVVLGEACPLTGQPAEISEGQFDGWTVTGPNTDGTYRIARSVIPAARRSSPELKAKIVSWIVDKHRAGEPEPMVRSDTFEQAAARPKMTYDQLVDRFFLLLKKWNFSLGRTLRVAGIMDKDYLNTIGHLAAWLEASNESDVRAILTAMASEGLLRQDNDFYRLTAEGVRRLDKLSSLSAESTQAFVAMWFSSAMDLAYEVGFEPAISDNGFRALRIDKKEHSNKIDDEIIAEIRRSRFVVADFTCALIDLNGQSIGIPRGGVYYEAGFAQGLKIDVIWTVRADCMDHVHFDTRQYAHIVWTDPSDLRQKLRNRIGAVIGRAN